MKKLSKIIRRVWGRIKPMSCRRCQGFLYSKTDRARGISARCRKLEIEEKTGMDIGGATL